MSEKCTFTVPDYYPTFACKEGECRRSCCQGWPISMSMPEYFRLLGVDCSPELRRRLDTGLHLAENPAPERYAQLLPDWRGDCPLHRDDGLCSLHAELGEATLCDICRLYPRSPRRITQPECACSNSCERTLELLFARPEPLSVIQMELPFAAPEAPSGLPEPIRRHYIALRHICMDLIQDRSRPLAERIAAIGSALKRLQPGFAALDESAIEAALEDIPEPEAVAPDEKFALSFLAHFNRAVGLGSHSVHDYAAHAIEWLGLEGEEPDEAALERYRGAKARFKARYGDWEVWFEHVLANHIFYESFPFSDRHEGLWDEYLSLAAVYGYFAFLAVTWTDARGGVEALVDVIAAAFRLIDHSAFDYNAAVILDARMKVTERQMGGFVRGVM